MLKGNAKNAIPFEQSIFTIRFEFVAHSSPRRNRLKRTTIVSLAATLMLLCALPLISTAQRKSSGAQRRRPAAPAPTPAPDLRAEAAQVAEQIKNFSKFLYGFGKVTNGFEIAEDQTKRGEMNPAAAAIIQKNKEAVYKQVSTLRAGLDGLAQGLKAKPSLQVQYLKISYAAEAAAEAERLAAATRWDETGKALNTVIERLAEGLVSFRQ
jgi:hypothetical protein